MSANTGLQPQAFWKSSFRDRYDIWAIKREIVRFEHHTVICRSSIHSTVGQNSKIYEKMFLITYRQLWFFFFKFFQGCLHSLLWKLSKCLNFISFSIKKKWPTVIILCASIYLTAAVMPHSNQENHIVLHTFDLIFRMNRDAT